MANPQPDKYIRISTELFEALCKIRINGEARQMFDFIMRKTYGFHKKEDSISTMQIIAGTGLVRHAVHKARKKLKEMNLISVTQKGDTNSLTYSIQKDYDKWKVYPKKVTVPQKDTRCTPKRSRSVPQKDTPIYTKDIKDNTKERFELAWKNYPNKTGKTKALKYFLKTVKTDKDFEDLKTALINYKRHLKINPWKHPQNGDTWFNNWRDWVDYKEPEGKTQGRPL